MDSGQFFLDFERFGGVTNFLKNIGPVFGIAQCQVALALVEFLSRFFDVGFPALRRGRRHLTILVVKVVR